MGYGHGPYGHQPYGHGDFPRLGDATYTERARPLTATYDTVRPAPLAAGYTVRDAPLAAGYTARDAPIAADYTPRPPSEDWAMADTINITIWRGDSHARDIPVQKPDGSAYPLSNTMVRVTAVSTAEPPVLLFAHVITIDGAGAVGGDQDSIWLGPDGVSGGLVIHRIDPDDSATWAPGTYRYDADISYPSDVVPGETDTFTFAEGTLTIIADIAGAVTAP